MSNPYQLWDTRRSLGVMREVKPDPLYWTNWFQNQVNSEDEYIDFEKLPIEGRKLAAFALPLARGHSVYDDSARTYRFKPAYIKLEDEVDPLKGLRREAGIDPSMLAPVDQLTPMQRRELIRAQISAAHVRAIRRTWNYMAARAIIDGKITLTGANYPTTLIDFGRAANHTITLEDGSRLGDTGISAVDFFQLVMDRMNDAEFGGLPTRVTMGGGVWSVLRKDEEFRDHMDINIRGGNITVERGLVGAADGSKVFKVGEMSVGGGSGQVIELWVDNETYLDPVTKAQTRYLGAKEMVFTASPAAVEGFQCFGRIIDPKAQYQALPIFPSNWIKNGDPEVEYLTHKSAPLMVPINPNATLKVVDAVD